MPLNVVCRHSNDDKIVFAGAYHGWGFHEDGAASGLRAAQRLGATWPSSASDDGRPWRVDTALYRTRITHLRRAPVHHYFEHRSYSWYVDIDRLPELPRWLRPFARFDASDHFDGEPDDTLRERIDGFLADRGIDLRGGTVTALLQARVLGYVFNPLSLYWCHDADGVLRHVVAEVHNTYGGTARLPAAARRAASPRW